MKPKSASQLAIFKTEHSNAIQSIDTVFDANMLTDDARKIIKIFVFYDKAIMSL